MPIEDVEEEDLAKIPDLNVAQIIFTLKNNPVNIRPSSIKEKLATPLNDMVCKELK